MTLGCSAHRGDPKVACSTCHRIGIEADIVTRTVDALLAAGYALAVSDGGDLRPEKPSRDREVVLRELMETDDDFLGVWKLTTGVTGLTEHTDLPNGWVYFVYGNDGWDVINDYTVNLEPVLAPVNAYVDSIAP
jgi:hypothetical protein